MTWSDPKFRKLLLLENITRCAEQCALSLGVRDCLRFLDMWTCLGVRGKRTCSTILKANFSFNMLQYSNLNLIETVGSGCRRPKWSVHVWPSQHELDRPFVPCLGTAAIATMGIGICRARRPIVCLCWMHSPKRQWLLRRSQRYTSACLYLQWHQIDYARGLQLYSRG